MGGIAKCEERRRRMKRRTSKKKGRMIFRSMLFIACTLLLCVCFIISKQKSKRPEIYAPFNKSAEKTGGKKDKEKEADNLDEEIGAIISGMTLEEKAAQLFIVLPESITNVDTVVAAGGATKAAIDKYPVGGFMYMQKNLLSPEQVRTMLRNTQEYSKERTKLPMFLCIDEEGGLVARIGRNRKFHVPVFDNISEIGLRGDVNEVADMGRIIGGYLNELGFNVDFAPVADLLGNSENTVIKDRAFGENPELVAKLASAFSDGLKEKDVCSTFKHFPGHGAVKGDTHEGYAYTSKSLEEIKEKELYPFQKGIENGVDFIMAGHISLPGIVGDDTPASMSEIMISKILRGDMGYKGIVITDALNMGAVSCNYTSAQAAKEAILAGCDMILMPENFYEAYNGLLEAVRDGDISEERIDESLNRIIKLKLQMR